MYEMVMIGAEIILKLRDVCKEYNNKLILNNINLDIYKGEIMGIVGASGS